MSRTASLLALVAVAMAPAASPAAPGLDDLVDSWLPRLGHRNWIVIVDAAYPLQTSPGLETVVIDRPHLDVVREVLAAIDRAPHVRPVLFLDAELPYVAEDDAPGIARFRRDLAALLGKRAVNPEPHEQIIERLDQAGRNFKILAIKTPLVLPYTSVFIRLDCGYWSDEAEQRLRRAMTGR